MLYCEKCGLSFHTAEKLIQHMKEKCLFTLYEWEAENNPNAIIREILARNASLEASIMELLDHMKFTETGAVYVEKKFVDILKSKVCRQINLF